tara:strand:+ start:13464 stop:14048 length:585 start_codon:yes stop_codon:yes gene_type:complete
MTPSLSTRSRAALRLEGLSVSGTSITINPVGDGKGALLMEALSMDADAAFHADVSATNSLHGVPITVAHELASYLLMSLSRITPNFPPSSIILNDLGCFPSPAAHASSNQAARWPIPPPTNTAFSGLTLRDMSRILALSPLGSIGRSMWNICWPIFAAICGSFSVKSSFSFTSSARTSASSLIGSIPPPAAMEC